MQLKQDGEVAAKRACSLRHGIFVTSTIYSPLHFAQHNGFFPFFGTANARDMYRPLLASISCIASIFIRRSCSSLHHASFSASNTLTPWWKGTGEPPSHTMSTPRSTNVQAALLSPIPFLCKSCNIYSLLVRIALATVAVDHEAGFARHTSTLRAWSSVSLDISCMDLAACSQRVKRDANVSIL